MRKKIKCKKKYYQILSNNSLNAAVLKEIAFIKQETGLWNRPEVVRYCIHKVYQEFKNRK